MKIGFTGTRHGMTGAQSQKFYEWLNSLEEKEHVLHHGCCIGADVEAHNLFVEFLKRRKDRSGRVVVHPPTNKSAMAAITEATITGKIGVMWHVPRPYLQRNHDIVDACSILIATPGGTSEVLRSGTWATIRYAKKCRKETIIIWPDGSDTQECFF